ncbi:flagellar export chaperone FliS [Thiosulfativibrio zosterae]|uniref:Flagellar secretion chaperone FliS n=1 Tax=Thiosulfativibrio zosterae TaxID=2675053 RepID=A0A6F8PM13_9GAMM|nr:flagellar export chaperone FliS [Thiosulfativibrio zosterae]BBP43126.1 flagellar protein FliS [Thiosulfativibrio zosterae]
MSLAARKNFAQQYANTYLETSISEASPHRLIELLYEGAMKNLKLSKIFIEQKNYEKKSEHLNKTLSIVISLREGVSLDKGGDVAQNLYALYDYCYRRLVKASIKNDIEILDEVLGYIAELSEAWKQIPDNYKKLSKDSLDKLAS